MKALEAFNLTAFLDTLLSLVVAFILGTLIGAERQYRQRTAGLRTNALVALGASAFVDLGMRLTGLPGAVQILAYIVTGIGFLGAGVIAKEGMNVTGLNTAATLWCSAAVGAFSGADRIAEAALLAVFVLAGNTLLRPVVNAINRTPLDERSSEATYEVHVTTHAEAIGTVRDLVVERLEQANYPVREVQVIERGADEDSVVEVMATLLSTAVEPDELDAVTTALAREPHVTHATWSARTTR